jgi:RNA polymerase primary sigma factor
LNSKDQASVSIEYYLKQLGAITPTLSASEERVLLKKWKDGDKDSFCQLVLHNQYIAIEEVLYLSGCGVEITDLIQEANLALIKALTKYKEKSNNTLKGYLHFYIFRLLESYICNKSSLVRIPANRFKTAYSQYEYNQINTSASVNMPINYHKNRDRNFQPDIEADRGDTITYFRCSDSILDIYSYEDDYSEESEIEIEDQLTRALGGLKDIERKIITLYYGLDDNQSYTLQEIGALMGFTRERARQIKEKALERLMHTSRRHHFLVIGELLGDDPPYDESEFAREIRDQSWLDPFNNLYEDVYKAEELLEHYIQSKRRSTAYPTVKNMSGTCRAIIIDTLQNSPGGCTTLELKLSVEFRFPKFKQSVFEHALRTAEGVISLGAGRYTYVKVK